MPAPRRSESPRSGRGRPEGPPARRGRTDANERRAPARPRGENPYKRAAKPEAPLGRRSGAPRKSADRQPAEPPARKGWGSLARKGAATVREEGPGRASSRQAERIEKAPERRGADRYVLQAGPKSAPSKRKNTNTTPAETFSLPPDAIAEIKERAGLKKSDRLVRSLKEASKAYAAERWGDVRKSLRPLLQDVPDAPVVIELNGMLQYRTGKWAAAYKDLEVAHNATQSYDLYPAMMDSQRALKKPKKVEQLWNELREASPSGEVMAEGRIVMANVLADQERLQDAIRLLEKTPRGKGDPKLYHLRSWYALADMYERTGDVGKARRLFEKVAAKDPEVADVLERIAALD